MHDAPLATAGETRAGRGRRLRVAWMVLAMLPPASCGLQPLDPLPPPVEDAGPALPETEDPTGEAACRVGPWLQRDEPCVATIAGHPTAFATLEPRTFCMGRPAGCAGLLVDEGENDLDGVSYAARPVRISRGFRLMRTEVTRALWRAVLDAPTTDPELRGPPPGDPRCDGDDCPIHGLTWSSAAAFANLASRAAGLPPCYRLDDCPADTPLGPDYTCAAVAWDDPEAPGEPWLDCPGYRLPTEAEWEYAAHLDSEAVFYPLDLRCTSIAVGCVERDGDRDLLAALAHHCADDGAPRPVAGIAAQHPLGLHDLLGNVAEWVFDPRRPYALLPDVDPTGAPDPARLAALGLDPPPPGADADAERIARGGSWRKDPAFVNTIRRATREADEIESAEVGLRLAIRFGAAQGCAPVGSDR